MTDELSFLITSEVIEIHDKEMIAAGGLSGIRDINALEAAVAAPEIS